MDVRQLELFLAVIENSSVTGAARKINLSAGAVSVQLTNLAAELHTELFVRVGRRLSPTPAALHLAERAREVIRQMQDIKREFENRADRDTRPFCLATGATTLIHRLGKPLRYLRKRYPDTPIQVTVSATEEMVTGLLDRRFDLALISLPYTNDNLIILPLFEEELVVLRPSATSVRGWHVGAIQPAELATASFLLYPKKSNMRSFIDGYFKDLGINPKVMMEADDTEAIKRLVEAGFGYSILPEYALRKHPRFYQLFRVPGRPLMRKQALAMARLAYPRALTESIARFLQTALGPA